MSELPFYRKDMGRIQTLLIRTLIRPEASSFEVHNV